MSSRDDLLAFLRSLLDTRYRRHLAEGLPDATARREALRDVEEWTRALDDGTLEFLEWIPTAERRERPYEVCPDIAAGEQLTLV